MAARRREGDTALAKLYQAGSAKALFPRNHQDMAGGALTAVLLNTAGGITGGDRFAWAARADGGAHLTLSTQTAERAYRALPGETGQVTTRLTAAAGATLHWLPQETILYDRAALIRRLDVDLAPDATLLAVEPIVFGRHAMGETLGALRFADHWRVRRGGQLVYADSLRLDGDAAATLARPGTLDGAGAMASLLLVSPDAERLLDRLRELLPASAGASCPRAGLLTARILAPSGFDLRRHLIPMLELLRGGPLPQVWKI